MIVLHVPLRKALQKKRALQAKKQNSPKIITISLVNPPRFYRKAPTQKTYYYF